MPRGRPQLCSLVISNPNPNLRSDPNPNCIAYIFVKVKNWGCLGLSIRRSEVFHILIFKLLTSNSPLTHFTNLVTIVSFLEFVMDCEGKHFLNDPVQPKQQNKS